MLSFGSLMPAPTVNCLTSLYPPRIEKRFLKVYSRPAWASKLTGPKFQ